MSRPVQVWLLARGGPGDAGALPGFLRGLLRDPDWLGFPVPWLLPLVALLLGRLWTPRLLPAVEAGGEAPQRRGAEEQARLLGRTLGEGFAPRPVFRHGGLDAAEAAASVARGDRVVLLSLDPWVGGPTRSSVRAARAALASRGAAIAEVTGWGGAPGYVEAVAESARAAITDLNNPAYGLLFVAPGLPARAADRAAVQGTVDAVAAALGSRRPRQLAWIPLPGSLRAPGPSVAEAMAALAKQAEALVVVPLGLVNETFDARHRLQQALDAGAAATGLQQLVRAAPVTGRPTYTWALADLVRSAAQEAGWATS